MSQRWNCVSAQGSEETRMMGLSDGRNSFQIGLAVLIQYRSVTASQPAVSEVCWLAVFIGTFSGNGPYMCL